MGGRRVWTAALAGRVLALVLLVLLSVPALADDAPAVVPIAYITQKVKHLPPLSLVDPPTMDQGLLGARLGIEDNNTTGRFTGQKFELAEAVVPENGDVVAAFRDLYAKGQRLFVVDLPAASLLKLADLPEAKDALLFNVQAKDDALRGAECRTNVLHVMPSYAMLADALAQYLVWKRWTDWFLVVGTGEEDKKFAAALRRAAKRFRADIVEERTYDAAPGARRTDTGSVLIQKQMPVFTQNVDYQVLVVADEQDAFGQYLPYRTWDPRPVVGTHGLWPTAWYRAHEQWGGTQMQDRFTREFGRWMLERDYTAWLAVRSVGEAATQTKKTDFWSLMAYIRSPDFAVAGFKGQKLTFRDWDGQLRQPILLAEARTIVSVSPQEGFKHQTNVLDTLGVDRPETTCKLK
ncbi:MAG: ABC transporter substrate-binding protein [Rhodospirillaceae bacterium]|nr:ABC transporter substrate-binding protein [Rhodospirillaceae bacterium]